jgi:LDH2 family malate/lactate/ureidoglycolate dehydrogenase
LLRSRALPGNRSADVAAHNDRHATRAARWHDGIPIPPALVRSLDQVADDLGMAKLG